MARLTEPQKVSEIVRALERELNGDLFLADLDRKVGHFKVIRKGFGSELGRPDALVWIELDLRVLGVWVSLRVPILVEAEEAGINAAKEDAVLFFERESLELPMVVVSRVGDILKETVLSDVKAKVEVSVHQIGFDRIPKG